jgi:hypothetical protein
MATTQTVQPDVREKCPQLKGALLVRLTADANEFAVKGTVGYLKVLEISRYGGVIVGLLYPLTEEGTVSGFGEVINPKWEAVATTYNEATKKVEVVPPSSFTKEEDNLICHALALTYINHAKEKAAWEITKKIKGI